MPSNKIYTVLVLCLGIVVSIWLLQRKPENVSPQRQNNNAVSAYPYQNTGATSISNDDWKKILVSVDSKTQGITEDLTADNSEVFDATTLTAQMSKDFFSQYLLLKKGGNALTTDDVNKITNNILSSQTYNTKGAVYVVGNLHMVSQTDPSTVKKYQDIINLILKTRSTQIKDDPVLIVTNAVSSGTVNELPKLNLVITAGKELINDLLSVDVPNDAVIVHLGLLNSVSSLLSDLEAMRQMYIDPVRALSGIGQYNKDIANFQISLNKMNAYLEQKTR